MRPFIILLLPLIFIALCLGCTSPSEYNHDPWMHKDGKLKVLCTIAMIGDLVQQIGGKYVDVDIMIKRGLNPHAWQPVKGDNEKLLFADLVFYNGLGLEHSPSLISFFSSQTKCIGLGGEILQSNPDLVLKLDNEVDPHIWMDVSLWSKTVPFIVLHLSRKDPGHAEYYQMNGELLLQRLEALHRQIKEQMQAIPSKKRFLITSHDAFNYFARAYLADEEEQKNEAWKYRLASPEGLAPESQVGIAHIWHIVEFMNAHDVHVIFPESNVSKDSLLKIAKASRQKGKKVVMVNEPLYSDGMGEPGSGGDTYEKMILHNAKTIAHYLNRE